MRQDITFTSQGLRCSGWLYVPNDLPAEQKMPAIVMAHGFSAVKEMYLSNFADRFVGAGFITLVFDYRYFGNSKGEPRGQFFPYEQIEDYRNAVTWISGHSQVDPERIGVWGTSKSGGHVLFLAAYDKRIKAVVAQVPSVISPEARRRRDPEKYDKLGAFLIQDRIERYKTGSVHSFKVVAPEGEPSVLGTREAYEWFTQASGIAPNWRNQVTVESLEKEREFDPVAPIQLIAPTPLLLIGAEYDTLALPDLVAAAYERALEPKSMLLLACRHFDVYNMEPWLSKAAGAAVEWFTNCLREPHAPGRQSAV
jgi:fermentation-respiration switch protein FrsA (DUF1100 family)